MNAKLTTIALASLIALTTFATAQAQIGYNSPATQQPNYNFDGNVYFGTGGTVWGSYLHGYADLARGVGQYNVLTSQANINNQTAYSMALDNHKQKIATYFESKQMNRSYRDQLKPVSKSTPEVAASWAKAGVPGRLTASHLDPETGDIHWPEVLSRDEFASCRGELERLFQDRVAAEHGNGSQTASAIRGQASEMKAQLNKLVKELPVEEFSAGRKFIDSLSYEARFAPEAAPKLAANR